MAITPANERIEWAVNELQAIRMILAQRGEDAAIREILEKRMADVETVLVEGW